MGWEILFVFGLTIGAVALLATDRLPADMVAILVMVALLLSRIVTPEEGLAGFANTATVTVAAMFVLSAGLFRTGSVKLFGVMLDRLSHHGRYPLLIALMITSGVLSAFLNNTAVVAILIPVIIQASRRASFSPSRLLMPLSFASILGGTCTLIGTSTNILASTISERYGFGPLHMFEFARLGLVLFGVGMVYILVIGARFIPERRGGGDLAESYGLSDYVTDVILGPDAKSVGKSIAEAPLTRDLGVRILQITRDGRRIHMPGGGVVLRKNDILRIKAGADRIAELKEREGIVFRDGGVAGDPDFDTLETRLLEAVVAPNSILVGATLTQVDFRRRFGGTVLALRHRDQVIRERIKYTPLAAGDALLIDVPRDRIESLQQEHMFVIVSRAAIPQFRPRRAFHAVAVVSAVVTLASLGVVPIVVGAIAGAALMVMLGCLKASEAYTAIDWRVIFLLAGLLTLGAALEKTGGAAMLADLVVSHAGHFGPTVLLSAFFLLTSVMTEMLSNNAAIVLLAPIAIDTALSIGVSPKPFLIAVMIAASSSFMTPVGYQTNTMIYGPGRYRFADFLKVGTPLNLIVWGLSTWLIPKFWPL